MSKLLRLGLLCLSFLLLFVGCTPAIATIEPDPASPATGNQAYPDSELPVDSGTSTDQAGVETAYPEQITDPIGENETYPAPASSADSVTPTVRGGLEASDPAAFTLMSGDLQLVEFFAFW
jgi:hypothetical protein